VNRPRSRRAGDADAWGGVHDPHTRREWRRHAAARLRRCELFHGHGYPDAGAEADALLAWAAHLAPADLHDHLDAAPGDAERAALETALRRRIEDRLPVPYLTGEAWIGEFRFEVTPDVLIPRSFIGDLLLEGLEPWIPDPARVRRALDLCTGSGCLAILLAHAFPEADVDATDVSAAALAVAARNVALHRMKSRVHPLQSDLFAALEGRRYDLLVSNPPYVDAASMATLPQEYRHEPDLALVGGADGLDLVHAILAKARDHLLPGGLLVVEIGHNRAALEAAHPRLPFTWLDTHAGEDFVFLLAREDLPA
jgi:ribosomal protein L3 glutamine methyltransferase